MDTETESNYFLIGKIHSSKLDGNLSVVLLKPEKENAIYSDFICTLFDAEGKTELASFHVGLLNEEVLDLVEQGKLFSKVEDMYLNLLQYVKDKNKNICLN